MNKTTFAQLPGLQKAGQILKLQEQINQHHLWSAQLLQLFNDLTQFNEGFPKPAEWIQEHCERIQLMCEYHASRAMYLQAELNNEQYPS